jgi:hypothetical protein
MVLYMGLQMVYYGIFLFVAGVFTDFYPENKMAMGIGRRCSATAISAFLSTHFIPDQKLAPIIPMLVGITALSIITLKDKRDGENREWTLSSWEFHKTNYALAGRRCDNRWFSFGFNS